MSTDLPCTQSFIQGSWTCPFSGSSWALDTGQGGGLPLPRAQNPGVQPANPRCQPDTVCTVAGGPLTQREPPRRPAGTRDGFSETRHCSWELKDGGTLVRCPQKGTQAEGTAWAMVQMWERQRGPPGQVGVAKAESRTPPQCEDNPPQRATGSHGRRTPQEGQVLRAAITRKAPMSTAPPWRRPYPEP